MRAFKITRNITVRNSNTINKYFQDISKIPLLTPEEEANLALRARKGDEVAFEKLVKANLRFVVSVAKQYQNQGLCLEELIEEGNFGLMKAIRKYDVTMGFRLISYAIWWIRQSILKALAEHSRIVRLPLNRIGALNKINKAYAKLEQEFERNPTPHEIAEVIEGISAWEVSDTLKIANKSISLDSPLPGEETGTLYEKIAYENAPSPEKKLIEESLRIETERALQNLTSREAEVVRLYFGIGVEHPFTLEEIGKRFDLTRERVRQIKEKALRQLRSGKKARLLQKYLE